MRKLKDITLDDFYFKPSIETKRFYRATVRCDGCRGDCDKAVEFFTYGKKRDKWKALVEALKFQGWGLDEHNADYDEPALLCPICALKISLEDK